VFANQTFYPKKFWVLGMGIGLGIKNFWVLGFGYGLGINTQTQTRNSKFFGCKCLLQIPFRISPHPIFCS